MMRGKSLLLALLFVGTSSAQRRLPEVLKPIVDVQIEEANGFARQFFGRRQREKCFRNARCRLANALYQGTRADMRDLFMAASLVEDAHMLYTTTRADEDCKRDIARQLLWALEDDLFVTLLFIVHKR